MSDHKPDIIEIDITHQRNLTIEERLEEFTRRLAADKAYMNEPRYVGIYYIGNEKHYFYTATEPGIVLNAPARAAATSEEREGEEG